MIKIWIVSKNMAKINTCLDNRPEEVMLFRFFKVFPNADAFEFCFYIIYFTKEHWEKHKHLHLGTF